MSLALYTFPECRGAADRLASALDLDLREVHVHTFPDGESLVRVDTPVGADTVFLYRSLDHPNTRLVELLLATSALRNNGAQQVVLVAPYLGYMRQDMAFNLGEAVSQRVIGALLAGQFDGVFTLDPHLHRVSSLQEIMPGIAAPDLTAAPVLSQALDDDECPVLVGPDSESRQWVEGIAGPLGLDVLIGEKFRSGDRDVFIRFDELGLVIGRSVVLVDDVISSGETLCVAAQTLRDSGATRVEAMATHCLAGEADLARMKAAGIARIRATDSVSSPVATLPTAPVLAAAIRKSAFWPGAGGPDQLQNRKQA